MLRDIAQKAIAVSKQLWSFLLFYTYKKGKLIYFCAFPHFSQAIDKRQDGKVQGIQRIGFGFH
jgi:hypothetical protein